MTDQKIRPSLHPNIKGREVELRSMVEAVRKLNRITILNNADPETTAAITKELESLVKRLAEHLPKNEFKPHRHPPEQKLNPDGSPSEPQDLFQYDGFAGPYNPISLPLKFEWNPPIAIGWARFNEIHTGPPMCVHGGFISGYFDQILTYANSMNATTGPTASLTINYRKPTPINVDLRFEAFVDYVAGSRIHTKGKLYDGDVLTAEAEGLFIKLTREQIEKLGQRSTK